MIRIVLSICLLLLPGTAEAGQSVWTAVERTAAVGDVHGDFEQFVAVLRSADLIDEKIEWSGGKTHLVQLGDIPDRGPDTRKVMDLMMRLQEQARAAGGEVHALIGNHDAMSVYGDLRYITPAEFAAFRNENSESVRSYFYQEHLKEIAADPKRKEDPPPDDAYRKAWEKEHPLGYFEHRFNFGPNGPYGKWIRQHNAVIRINETLFSHAGISPKYADMDLDTINNRIREELQDPGKLQGGITLDTEGPLWYRGWARESGEALAAQLEEVLTRHGAKRMVLGHTPTEGAIMPRFSGRILLADVGLAQAYGSRLACLVIEKGKAYAIHRGTKLAIPSEEGIPLLRYLKTAAALDPPPSPLLPEISRIEETLSAPLP